MFHSDQTMISGQIIVTSLFSLTLESWELDSGHHPQPWPPGIFHGDCGVFMAGDGW